MDKDTAFRIAQERASRHAPPVRPEVGGVIAIPIFAALLFIFFVAMGMDTNEHQGAVIVTVGLGAALVFGFLKLMDMQHLKMLTDEYNRLLRERDAPRP